MYKVLIIDDEKYVIKALELSLPWEQLQLQLCATAASADEALSILHRQPVDIIITDIQMPGISGLEFIRRLHTANQNIPILVISGYAEFTYAQEAMKYGVIGYCLKPLDYEEVSGYLRIACSRLQNGHGTEENILEYLDSSDASRLDLYLAKNNINCEHFHVCTSIGLPDLFSRTSSASSGATASGVFPEALPVLTLKLGRSKYAYLSNTAFSSSFDTERFTSCCGGIGICQHPVSSSLLKKTINDCYMKSYQYFIAGHTTICHELPQQNSFEILTRLASCLKDSYEKGLDDIFSQIRDTDFEENYTVQFAFNLCNLVFSSQLFAATPDSETCYLDYDQMVTEYISFEKMLNSLEASIHQCLTEKFSADNKLSTNFLSIIKYINDHYTQNLSLNSIGEALHMNPNYISQLFRKETNTSYIKYLTRLRIEYARTLLDTTELSVGDICEKTGFNDYFYFLKSFKKAVGVSPTQYKNRCS